MGENKSTQAESRGKVSDIAGALLGIILLPLLILLGVCFLIYSILFHITLWLFYCTRGINVLLVYSNSPVWQEYFEDQIIPKLPANTLILNWSDRSKWNRVSLPVRVFRHFGGDREFNPMAVVLRPFRRTGTFRFWKPFKDFKHGNDESLKSVETELLKELNSIA